jgi:tRNA threonylcarbamoyladenosine biosynthesis protein TsaB
MPNVTAEHAGPAVRAQASRAHAKDLPSPPLILAVETSSRIGSVAMALGGKVLTESQFSNPLRHSAEIFPAIRSLLDRFARKPAEVEHVYMSGGPGSFTGLRIAATLAKMMHLANGARIVAVDTLDVIAANVVNLADQSSVENHELPSANCDRIASVLDAKRGQFFIAVYQRKVHDQPEGTRGGIWTKVLPDSLMTIPQFLTRFARRAEPLWLLGDGLVYYKDKFEADGIRFFDQRLWSPRARNVHLLGWQRACQDQFAEPLTLTPTYLRKPDVIIKSR